MEWMSIVEVVFEAVPSLVTIAIAIYRQGADALLVLSISVSALAALHALFTVLKQYSESSILREVARRGVLECFGRPQFYKHVTWASFKNVAEGLHPLGFEAIRSSKDAGVGAVVVITLRVDVQHLEKALAGASGGRISRAGLRMAAKEGSEAAARFLAGRVRQGIGRMTRDEPLRMALFRAVTREVQQRLVGQKDALFKHWDNIESWVHSLALHSVKGARAVGDTIEASRATAE